MDSNTFRKFGHTFVDWVADYFDELEQYPVMAEVQPGDILKQLPTNPPLEGESMETIFDDFKKIIMPGITQWQHPGWFAYFPANNSPPSVLAELLTAGIGAQCMIWQTSPAAAELEERVMEWLREMLGLPQTMTGVIQDTASTATLCALLTARERATDFQANQAGLTHPITLYASEETHSSFVKGAKIAGFGEKSIRHIPTDDTYAMIPAALEAAILRDKEAGHRPACVVATVGTTSSTAVDPVASIGEICHRHNVWLHVDAAFAGTAAMLPEKRHVLNGMDKVDSFVFNPHKWMFTNFDCSAYFVQDPGLLIRTFEIHPEYLKTGVDAKVKNYRDWGVPLGRRFRALKLWFVIRSYGMEGIRKMVREHIRLAGMFAQQVTAHEHFELLAPVNFSLVCFRFNDGRPPEALDRFNRELMARINRSAKVFLTHTVLRGQYTLRLVVGSRSTQERHVNAAWELVSKTAEAMRKP